MEMLNLHLPHQFFCSSFAFLLFDTDRNDKLDFTEFLMAKAFESAKTLDDALDYLFDM
jgi:hypothetical protein